MHLWYPDTCNHVFSSRRVLYSESIAFLHSSASDDFMAAINPVVSLVEDSSLVSKIVARGTVDNASVDS